MKISVITVTYQAADTVRDALRSVAGQTHPDLEHLIIDGASADGTMAAVAEFGHVAMAVSEPDSGIYDAMNKGLRLATGDAVCFLNADDFYCRDDAIASAASAFAQSGADAVSGGVAIVRRDDPARVRRHYGATGFRPWMLRFGHQPPHPALFVRREMLERLGGFDRGYRIAGDFDLILRMYRAGARVAALPDTLVGFRDGGASVDRLTMNREILRALRAAGMTSNAAMLWARYPFKSLQLLRRPHDYAPPPWLG